MPLAANVVEEEKSINNEVKITFLNFIVLNFVFTLFKNIGFYKDKNNSDKYRIIENMKYKNGYKDIKIKEQFYWSFINST